MSLEMGTVSIIFLFTIGVETGALTLCPARSIRGGAASHLHPPSSEGVPPLDPRARAAVAGREVVEGQRTGEGSSAVSGVVSSLL